MVSKMTAKRSSSFLSFLRYCRDWLVHSAIAAPKAAAMSGLPPAASIAAGLRGVLRLRSEVRLAAASGRPRRSRCRWSLVPLTSPTLLLDSCCYWRLPTNVSEQLLFFTVDRSVSVVRIKSRRGRACWPSRRSSIWPRRSRRRHYCVSLLHGQGTSLSSVISCVLMSMCPWPDCAAQRQPLTLARSLLACCRTRRLLFAACHPPRPSSGAYSRCPQHAFCRPHAAPLPPHSFTRMIKLSKSPRERELCLVIRSSI